LVSKNDVTCAKTGHIYGYSTNLHSKFLLTVKSEKNRWNCWSQKKLFIFQPYSKDFSHFLPM